MTAPGCGLMSVYGPKGWRKSLHVFMGGKTCCCGAVAISGSAEENTVA